MKKILKFLLFIGLGVVALIVLILAYIALFVDPNDYKDDIAAQASQATGRDVTLGGDLSISLFPALGFKLGEVTIGNAPGFSGEFAKVSNASVAVKLLPLLSKNLQVEKVILDGMQLNLAINANGGDNWSDIGADDGSVKETSSNESLGVASLSIAGIEISDTGMTLSNAQTGQDVLVSNVNLNVTEIALGKPVNIKGGLRVMLPAEQVEYQVAVEGKLRYEPSNGLAELLAMEVAIVDQSAQPLPEMVLLANGQLNIQSGELDLSSLELQADDLQLIGSITGNNVLVEPNLSGQFELAPFNPKSVAKAFGSELPALTDATVLEDFHGQLNLTVTPQKITVSQLQASLDDSTLTGRLSMTRTERPSYQFTMNVDQINLDRYLPEADVASQKEQTATPTISPIPVETFRAIDAEGEFNLGAVTINGLDATDVSVTLQTDRNGWRFRPLSANFYDGQFNGAISIDATGESPILRTDDNLNEVLAQALLQDMLGTDFVAGLALFEANIDADINQPVETLNGEVSFDIRDGAIYGVNIAELLRKGFSVANNLSSVADLGAAANLGEEFLQGGGQTDFASLSGKFFAENGVITNNDLSLKSPLLRVSGLGTVDLPNNRIDYEISAALVKSLEGQGTNGEDQLIGKQIPIRITGTLDEPKYSVDPAVLIDILAGERVQELKDKVLDQIGGQLGDGEGSAKSLLDGVLNQTLGTEPNQTDDTVIDEESAEAVKEPKLEEEVAGAVLNSIFGRKRDNDAPADEDEDND